MLADGFSLAMLLPKHSTVKPRNASRGTPAAPAPTRWLPPPQFRSKPRWFQLVIFTP
jgi:hypothetical protein